MMFFQEFQNISLNSSKFVLILNLNKITLSKDIFFSLKYCTIKSVKQH